VLLDVHEVIGYDGKPHGREGQPLIWVLPRELPDYPVPAANEPIVRALQLPPVYAITPEPEGNFPQQLQQLLAADIRLLQFRSTSQAEEAYLRMASEVISLCHARGTRVLLNCAPRHANRLGADGVHLSQRRLMQCQYRPLPSNKLVAASCHDAASLQHAADIGLDFAVLSPVQHTDSHPHQPALGWIAFQALVDGVALPVYALGGMTRDDISVARQYGGQGIAAIRSLWPPAIQ
jgi:8-oxo-dGTP diphosphatase